MISQSVKTTSFKPSVYACCVQDPDGQVGYSGPMYVAIRSAKHNKSTEESHVKDFNRLLQTRVLQRLHIRLKKGSETSHFLIS